MPHKNYGKNTKENYKLSLSNKNILIAIEKGYSLDKEGNIFSPKGQIKGKTTRSRNRTYKVISIKLPKELGGKITQVKAHRLQAYQKFGDELFVPKIEVRHLNGNSLDNSWDNLALGTTSENSLDKPQEIRTQLAINAASKLRKLTKEQSEKLREDRSSGFSYEELANKYDISKSTVSYVCNNKTYKVNMGV